MMTREIRDEAIAMFKQYELPYLKDMQILLAKEIELRQASQIQDAIVNVQKIAASLGLSVAELMQQNPVSKIKKAEIAKPAKQARKLKGAQKAASKPNPPMYRHPTDHELTWTGKGPAPKWLNLLSVKGKTRDDFLIKPN